MEHIEEYMTNLITTLNQATISYNEGHPIMSDKEWDDLYFELLDLEQEYDITLKNSPTHTVYNKTVDGLNKVTHSHPMLSLAKTKDINEIKNFIGDKECICMLKMDGLTCSLTYEDGVLVRAETRGNGIEGEDILHNAMIIPSIPKKLDAKVSITVDGEIICTYDNFEKYGKEYKNPRNYASGSIRLLNAKECQNRHLTFIAWDWINSDRNTLSDSLIDLSTFGFIIVPCFIVVNSAEIENYIERLKEIAEKDSFPIDGIVVKYDNRDYYESLGATEHHFRGGLAFKFYDETYPTILRDIEWSLGRTGVLTPVAIFDTVNIDGTDVSRASLHNVSVMNELLGTPYVGQEIEVFKSNQIIPQIYSAAKKDDISADEILTIPTECYICGEPLKIEDNNGIKTLVCDNSECGGQLINRLDHFAGKKGLDIKGLSVATLEKLMDKGWIDSFKDIFNLSSHREEWTHIPGFGDKSVDNILDAIESAKNTDFVSFIAALGIPLIGVRAAKDLNQHFSTYDEFRKAIKDGFDFSSLENFAEAKNQAIYDFDFSEADEISKFLTFSSQNDEKSTDDLKDLNFATSGSVQLFKNRSALQKAIEEKGGHLKSSVTKNVNYFITNDPNGTSSKIREAKRLGVPFLTEQEFVDKFLTN